jgi:hypothetical protein
MSSIDNKGENEYNYDESNIVGKSEIRKRKKMRRYR